MIRDGIVCYDCQRITSGDCGKHGPTTVTYGRTDSIPEPEGTWPADCVQRAFVAGAKWWQFVSGGATMFPSERHQAEAEAVKRYGDPTPEPERRCPACEEPNCRCTCCGRSCADCECDIQLAADPEGYSEPWCNTHERGV